MSDRDDYINEECYVITADVYGLSGAEFLADLSLGKIRAAYNGIGPEWMSQKFRDKLMRWLGLFSVCAVIHDCRFAYDNDGSAAKFNAANDELERNCIIVADANFTWYNPRRHLARLARPYVGLWHRVIESLRQSPHHLGSIRLRQTRELVKGVLKRPDGGRGLNAHQQGALGTNRSREGLEAMRHGASPYWRRCSKMVSRASSSFTTS